MSLIMRRNIKFFLMLLAIGLSSAVTVMAVASSSQDIVENLPFRNIGPAITGGKATAVTGIPGNDNVYYVGTGGGGLWKTVNGGASWQPVFEHGPSSSVGTIELSPKKFANYLVGNR
jgi:hypothetical protein